MQVPSAAPQIRVIALKATAVPAIIP